MKRAFTIILISVGSLFSNQAMAADPDVYPSNISSNVYFDNYNDNTKKINGVNFTILSDGSSTSNTISDFKVKLYLLVKGTTTNPIYVKTFDVSGFHEMSSKDFSDQTVDLSAVSGLSAGTYRLGVFVDADDDLSESNENNNTILFGGDIVYTSGTPTGSGSKADLQIESSSFDFNSSVKSIDNISIKIKNAGGADAAASDIKIEVVQVSNTGNSTSTTMNLSAISAGSSITITPSDFDISGFYNANQKYKLIITLDPGATVDESDETNNAKTVSADITKGVDGDGSGGGSTTAIIDELKAKPWSEGRAYSLAGNLVLEVSNEAPLAYLQSNLQSGVYIIKLSNGYTSDTKKIFVSK